MLKIIRGSIPRGPPEAEMTRHLTEIGFADAAPLLGEVVLIALPALMLAQGFVRNQGWLGWRGLVPRLDGGVTVDGGCLAG